MHSEIIRRSLMSTNCIRKSESFGYNKLAIFSNYDKKITKFIKFFVSSIKSGSMDFENK